DFHVTGVQTCALPISDRGAWYGHGALGRRLAREFPCCAAALAGRPCPPVNGARGRCPAPDGRCLDNGGRHPRRRACIGKWLALEIGRASCRETERRLV